MLQIEILLSRLIADGFFNDEIELEVYIHDAWTSAESLKEGDEDEPIIMEIYKAIQQGKSYKDIDYKSLFDELKDYLEGEIEAEQVRNEISQAWDNR